MKVTMRIDREVLKAFIPSMLLQPVVENAIKHGIARLSRKGELELVAHRINGDLSIEVTNDGPGYKINESNKTGNGLGLNNVRQRLLQLYGEQHSFVIENRGNGKVSVKLLIPFEQSTGTPA
jgi:LytS/YehU family sensor histidine kinase